MRLTKAQRELARHALGLTNGRTASYRNRFSESAVGPTHAEWMRMCRKGAAGYRSARAMKSFRDLFWLTYEGALLALNPGDTLDPEDFPQITSRSALNPQEES